MQVGLRFAQVLFYFFVAYCRVHNFGRCMFEMVYVDVHCVLCVLEQRKYLLKGYRSPCFGRIPIVVFYETLVTYFFE